MYPLPELMGALLEMCVEVEGGVTAEEIVEFVDLLIALGGGSECVEQAFELYLRSNTGDWST